jgi:hypothetical protein
MLILLFWSASRIKICSHKINYDHYQSVAARGYFSLLPVLDTA